MSHPQASPRSTVLSCCPDGSPLCISSKTHLKSWAGEGWERDSVSEGGTVTRSRRKSSTWTLFFFFPSPTFMWDGERCGVHHPPCSRPQRQGRGSQGADLWIALTSLKSGAAAPAPTWASAEVFQTRRGRTPRPLEEESRLFSKRHFEAPSRRRLTYLDVHLDESAFFLLWNDGGAVSII